MSKLEKDEEAAVSKWCRKNSIITIKFTPMGSRGWPDRIFILPTGVHVWMEFKRKGKKLRRLQAFRIQQITDQGGLAAWADSAEGAITFLQEVLDEIHATLISN